MPKVDWEKLTVPVGEKPPVMVTVQSEEVPTGTDDGVHESVAAVETWDTVSVVVPELPWLLPSPE